MGNLGEGEKLRLNRIIEEIGANAAYIAARLYVDTPDLGARGEPCADLKSAPPRNSLLRNPIPRGVKPWPRF